MAVSNSNNKRGDTNGVKLKTRYKYVSGLNTQISIEIIYVFLQHQLEVIYWFLVVRQERRTKNITASLCVLLEINKDANSGFCKKEVNFVFVQNVINPNASPDSLQITNHHNYKYTSLFAKIKMNK